MGLLAKKKRRTVSVPVASMGDIAFLLIIFFLVCSEESKEKSVDVVLPKSEYVDKIKAHVAARVAIDKNGAIFFDGQRVEGAKDVEWGVRAALARTVSDDQRHVQFKCHAGHAREVFEPVMQAIAEAGGIIEAVGEKAGDK
jgi:biopolymer transport protein ExbD